jgi:thioredoxin reductase (NADPH)
MSRPVLFAVDEDAAALRAVEQELSDRYAKHYRVIAMPSSQDARACLEELATSAEESHWCCQDYGFRRRPAPS